MAPEVEKAPPVSFRTLLVCLAVLLGVLVIWLGRPIVRFYQTPSDHEIRAEMTRLGVPAGQDGSETGSSNHRDWFEENRPYVAYAYAARQSSADAVQGWAELLTAAGYAGQAGPGDFGASPIAGRWTKDRMTVEVSCRGDQGAIECSVMAEAVY